MTLTISSYASSLNALKNIKTAHQKTDSVMEKLSSGLNINKAKDNPSGLMLSEQLRSQLAGFGQASANTQETNNMMSVAEGGLAGVSSMLNDMKSLATHALNSGVTTGGQTYADQLQINSNLTAINNIVSTTNYGGSKLLDGNKDIDFDVVDSGGMINESGTSISNIAGSTSNPVSVSYDGSTANQAEKGYLEADFGGAALSSEQKFTVTGNEGGYTFSFAEGTSVQDMADQINSMSDSTGVNAYAIRDEGTGATSIRLASTEYGSDAMVQVTQEQGSGFAAQGSTVRDNGQDATVSVNGVEQTGEGLNVGYSAGGATGKLALTEAVAQGGYDQDELVDASAAQNASLTNIKGGMQVQLGEGSGSQNRETVSLGNFSMGNLGKVEVDGETYSLNDLYSGGKASLENNPELAMKVIDQAISDVATARAEIGAYQANTLDSNAANLATSLENITAMESGIRDADMAKMVMELAMAQTQEQAGMSVMQMQMDRMNSTNIMQLLGGF